MNTYTKISRYILLTAFAIVLLDGCKQSDQNSENTKATTYLDNKQSVADVKQPSADVGSAIANSKARLTGSLSNFKDSKLSSLANVQTLYAEKASHAQVEDIGQVVKVLSDDNEGSRHQRFLVKTASGQTLLFTHNIDLASRVENIKAGDSIEFRGEYIYNEKGGIVHWTHHDPVHHHYDGWIKLNGNTYQ